MHEAFISIGSNLGDRSANCTRARRLLEAAGIRVVACSRQYRTEPWGFTDQPWFLNMAVKVESQLRPRELLEELKHIEREMGREKGRRWGPRVIDLDILLYGSEVVDEPDLHIPHPLMHEREFALRPLCEISPDAMHPLLKKTVKALLQDLRREQTV